jgi:hypothetical protein
MWLSRSRRRYVRAKKPARTGLSSNGPSFENLEARELLAAVQLSPLAGLQTSEDGGYAVVSAWLSDAPAADVTFQLQSDNPNEGKVSAAALTFTPQNFNQPQSIQVTGQSDCTRDGNKSYQLVTSLTSSADPNYDGLDVPDVSLTNLDARRVKAGIIVTPTKALETNENGGAATFTVALTCRPSAPVTVAVSSSDVTEGITDVSSVTIFPDDWNTPKPVQVTGLEDDLFDGPVKYKVTTAAAVSLDPLYNGRDAQDVSLVNLDRSDVARFDGLYVGSYTGKATVPGFPNQTVTGTVRFRVTNGQISVEQPGPGTGSLAGNGSAGFSTTGGAVNGATYSGLFRGQRGSRDVFVSGSWSYLDSGITAQGSWSATRVA